MKYLNDYWVYIKKNRKSYLMILFSIIIITLVSVSYTLILKVIIDDVLISAKYYILPQILIILIISFILTSNVEYSNGILVLNLTQNISINLRGKILLHIQMLKANHFLKFESGDLINRTNNDIDIITQFLSTSLLSLIANISNLFIYSLLMLFINKKLAIIAITVCTLQLFVSKKFSYKIKDINRKQKEEESKNLDFLAHTYKNNMFFKIMNKLEYNNNKYYNILMMIRRLAFEGFKIQYIYNTTISFLSYFASIILIGIGIYEIIMNRMTVGMLFVFDSISEKFYQYSNALMNFNVELQNAYVSMERLNEILSLETEKYEFLNPALQKETLGNNVFCIVIDNGVFKYNKKYIFENLNLQFVNKKSYIIMGPSGQGKTTLARILLGLYDLESGEVLINDMQLKKIPVQEVRNRITYVMQENTILNDTIRENLLLGNDSINEEFVREICRLCYIDEFVQKFEEGYDTVIGEKGIQLSEGQKQRISIARGMLRKSDVYIFDEITSNIDKKMGLMIIKNVQKILKDKITIYITHDLLLKEYGDQTILLNEFKVDLSRDMLAILNKKSREKHLNPICYMDDICRFNNGIKYDIIILSHISISLLDSKQQALLFDNISNNLLEHGGKFIFNFTYSSPKLYESKELKPIYYFNKKEQSFAYLFEKVDLEKKKVYLNVYVDQMKDGISKKFIGSSCKNIVDKKEIEEYIEQASLTLTNETYIRSKEGLICFYELQKV